MHDDRGALILMGVMLRESESRRFGDGRMRLGRRRCGDEERKKERTIAGPMKQNCQT